MNMPGESPALLNRAEVAALLNVSIRKVDTLATQGLPYILLGRRTARFDRDEVLAWAKRECGVCRLGGAAREE